LLDYNCCIVVFILIQLGIWLWADGFSPSLQALQVIYNHFPTEEVFTIWSRSALATRVGLIAVLVVILFFMPFLSVKAVRFSRFASQTIDITSTVITTILLFAFYGEAPGGLNAIEIVLRDKQTEINQLYGRAVHQASRRLLAEAFNQAARSNAVLRSSPSPPQGPVPPKPPPPGGSGNGPDGPAPEPRLPQSRTGEAAPAPDSDSAVHAASEPKIPNARPLGTWDRELFQRIVIADTHRTEETVRDIRVALKDKEPRVSKMAPKETNEAKLNQFHAQLLTIDADEQALPANTKAMRDILEVSFDANEFPKTITPAIEQLTIETVSGQAADKLMKVVSDNVVQEAVRSLAGNFVDEFIRQSFTAADLKPKVAEFASRLWTTDSGKKIWSAIQALGGYGESIASRLRAGQRVDPIVARATDSLVGELENSISELVTYPPSTRHNAVGLSNAKSMSRELGDQVIDTLASSAVKDDSIASKLLGMKELNRSSKTANEKSGSLDDLVSSALAHDLARSDIIVCACGIPPAQFYIFGSHRRTPVILVNCAREIASPSPLSVGK
jgi:hypothetical protein